MLHAFLPSFPLWSPALTTWLAYIAELMAYEIFMKELLVWVDVRKSKYILFTSSEFSCTFIIYLSKKEDKETGQTVSLSSVPWTNQVL